MESGGMPCTRIACVAVFALALVATSAEATNVTPVFVAGNPTCTGLGYDFGFKVDPPNAGAYNIPDGFGTITVTTDGIFFDWSSTLGIDAVIAKGGPNANLYIYEPPAESFGDTGLHSPINPSNGRPFGLSHIEFCYDIRPSVKVEKSGDELSKVGDTVTYNFTITNDGDVPLTLESVVDTLLGDLTANATAAGCGTLDPGDSCNFSVNRVVQAGDPDPLPNTVTITYGVGTSADDVEDDDEHSVNLFQPSITFDKSADTDLSKVGDVINYTVKLDNTSSGDSPDLVCTIEDALLGIDEEITLASGNSKTIEKAYTVQMGDPDPLVNTASVSCSPVGFPNVLEASDQVSVNLFQPSIEVEKTGNEFSKVGDTVTYEVEISNTSSGDTPTLILESFEDSLVAGVTPPEDCNELDPGESCTFSYTYTVQDSDDSGLPGATLTNTATATYNPNGFPNEVTDSASWDVTLLHPSFTVTKSCPSGPVPQEGPAVYTVVLENTGDADLIVTADEDLVTDDEGTPVTIEAGEDIELAAGETKTFTTSLLGPFDGDPEVSNTINCSARLAPRYDLPNTYEASSTDTCTVGGRVNLLKLTDGQVDDSQNWVFALYEGPHAEDGNSDFLDTPPLATDSTAGDVDGILDFDNFNLDPDKTYTVCERDVPAGFTTEWKVDTNGDGDADLIINPYDPNENDVPPEDLGNRCFDFGFGTLYPVPAGGTLVFEVNNTSPPGGEPRTPGYWKNWNTCTGGRQEEVAAKNGGPAAGFFLLDDLLPQMVGDLTINDCETGVKILDKRDLAGNKKANDAAYGLATALLAAQLNTAAGVVACPAVQDAVEDAQALLDTINFVGTGNYLPPPKGKAAPNPNRQVALELAGTLDQFNNGLLCP